MKPSREEVLKMALDWYSSGHEDPEEFEQMITVMLDAMYAKGAEEMRERAADVCDFMFASKRGDYEGKHDDKTLRANPYVEGGADAACDLGDAIRALPITPTNTEGEQDA